MISNYHTQAQKDELSQIIKERYGTDLEMNFYDGDE